jgi:hypothetical protein
MAPEDKAKEASEKEVESRKQMEKIDVGNRCMVTLQGQLPKKGTIMYKGKEVCQLFFHFLLEYF